ncbi:MAG: FKBP-type peptidyl-prolyl cis-trans isomerase [Lewinellaceae bacterium]|nr:FKBP-type peptidyl-prolyl cis-trans isomerase [Lewinellaceae bacterium]
MRYLFFFLVTAIAINLASCQEEGIVTKNGFRFINHTNLPGPKIQPGSTVIANINTWIGDTIVGSTYKAGKPRRIVIPTEDQVNGKKSYYFDACLLMTKGDSATITSTIDSNMIRFIPARVKNERTIRYVLKVEDVITPEQQAKQKEEAMSRQISVQAKVNKTLADFNSGALNSQLLSSPSGLKVLVEEKGKLGPVTKGETLSMQYYGVTTNGNMFDNSFQRGEPLSMPIGVGQLIKGMDEGAMMFNHGGKGFLFIPAALAYGTAGTPNGSIAPNTDLIFYIEIL